MQNKNEYRLEEWKSLRNEIERKQDLIHRIVFSVVGLNVAIYSFALQNTMPITPIITTLPLIISLISYYWIFSIRNSTERIVGYLRKPEFREMSGWESYLKNLEVGKDSQRYHSRDHFIEIFPLIFYFFCIFSMLLSFFLPWFSLSGQLGSWNWTHSFSLLLISFSFFLVFKYKYIGGLKNEFNERRTADDNP